MKKTIIISVVVLILGIGAYFIFFNNALSAEMQTKWDNKAKWMNTQIGADNMGWGVANAMETLGLSREKAIKRQALIVMVNDGDITQTQFDKIYS